MNKKNYNTESHFEVERIGTYNLFIKINYFFFHPEKLKKNKTKTALYKQKNTCDY